MLTNLFQFVKRYREDIILFIVAVLLSLFSFAAGYIIAKKQEKEPVKYDSYIDIITAFGRNESKLSFLPHL